MALRLAKNEFLVLLNPDAVPRAGWLEGIQAHFREDDIAAEGPTSNYADGLQFVPFHLPDFKSRPSFGELPAILKSLYAGQSLESKMLIGFCVMLRRSVLEQEGYLDEELFLGADDLELSWRLRQKGYRLLVARDVFVEHEGQVSFRRLPSEEKQRYLDDSTRILISKLEQHYGKGQVPSSIELFGTTILPFPEGYHEI